MGLSVRQCHSFVAPGAQAQAQGENESAHRADPGPTTDRPQTPLPCRRQGPRPRLLRSEPVFHAILIRVNIHQVVRGDDTKEGPFAGIRIHEE